jgi:hypothetical protein
MLFVLSLIIFLILGFFNKIFWGVFLIELVIYLSIIAIRSMQIKKNTTFFHQLLAFLVLHFSYGIGSLVGIFEVVKKQDQKD